MFASDGKCLDVAIDHGFFNEWSFLSGIEDMSKAVATVADARPDAVQLSPGQARHLQDLPGPDKPALVVRTDVANCYGRELPDVLFSELVDRAVETGVRLDAACLCVNLLLLPDRPELLRQCIANVSALRADCERAGMPLMVEPLVMQAGAGGGYMVDGKLEKIVPLVRQAAELGADVIKADPCDDLDDYHKVVEAASGRPVLVRGGGRASDAEILKRTEKVMREGARGIVYGRNVIQHRDPRAMVTALMSIVHKGRSAEEAADILGE
jgi:DhnA family fructose-bisphosphate aldolase class Ia